MPCAPRGAFAPSRLLLLADIFERTVLVGAMMEGEEPMSPDAGNPKGKKSPRARPQKGKAAERLKCSLLLTPENDLRLTVLASLRGTDRSTLLNTILDEALRGVAVSLRGPLAEAGAGEVDPDAAEPEAV